MGFRASALQARVRLSPLLMAAVASAQIRRKLCESETSEGIGDLPSPVHTDTQSFLRALLKSEQ